MRSIKKIMLLLLLLSVIFPTITIDTFEQIQFYPVCKPYREQLFKVSSVHTLYVAEFGNPQGVPVVLVHGGPGAGCSDAWTAFFDPYFYRIIMVDQRGAGRSRPNAEMTDNTPQALVEDMEALRKNLCVDKWILFGGSWGSALSLLYAQAHPDHVLGLVLRGVFLGREHEYNHLVYDMKKIFPDAWHEMLKTLNVFEDVDFKISAENSGFKAGVEVNYEESILRTPNSDLISLLHSRLMDSDPAVHLPAAHAFMRYDTKCATLLPNPELIKEEEGDDATALNIARAFIHFATNKFFLSENQIINELEKITHLPAIIINGRYDIICPPCAAYELHKKWPGSLLWIIPDAGHLTCEPSIARALTTAMNAMKAMIH